MNNHALSWPASQGKAACPEQVNNTLHLPFGKALCRPASLNIVGQRFIEEPTTFR